MGMSVGGRTYRETFENLENGLEPTAHVRIDEFADVRFLLDVHSEMIVLQQLRLDRRAREGRQRT